ncbi:hypothetical protein A2V68_02765 [candidate division Kazan bacterium RBG_13_50_9]|uniref:Metallo-beta-lactamase domain-containing protein n=1 Tax=candidate division Kazan bacterium RBG_13_50_9 TaxID=1798535 RepID=A0A1F4NSY4_UNCK3|nr:MAG: hypothetical protein A2V68_02765 [candidate division Kazan bacterium RBG_13_50_9]
MKLKFLGTRGYIEEKAKQHRMHSSLLVDGKVLFDFGKTWKGKLTQIKPKVIFITHAHPDHAGGLSNDIKVPVYAAGAAFEQLKKFKLPDLRRVRFNQIIKIGRLKVVPYGVVHSILAPAAGYRVNDGKAVFIYNPDIISIRQKNEILKKADLYIGDGATIKRPLVRRRGDKLFGHAAIFTQVNWCKTFGIRRAIFTHFGKEAVETDERSLKKRLREFGGSSVEVSAAYDGMEVRI